MDRNNLLSIAFENTTDGLLLMREEGTAVDCNRAAVRLLGCRDKSEIIGHHPGEFWPEYQPNGRLSTACAEEIFTQVATTGSVCFEWEHRRKDGQPLHVEVLLTSVADQGRRFIHVAWRDIQKRRDTELALMYRRALETLIVQISSHFISLAAEDIPSGIQKALADLGMFVDADRSYIFVYHDGQMHNLYEWCADGISPQVERMQGVPIAAMQWSNDRIMRGDILNTPCVNALPPEAQAEKDEFLLQGSQSVLVVPMVRRGEVVGFIGFDAVKQQRDWPEEVVDLLRLAGGIIANVLDRRDAELQLRETNLTLERRVDERTQQLNYRRRVAEALRDGLAVLNSERALADILHFVVDQAVHLLGTAGGALYQLDNDRHMLHVGAASGLDDAYTMLEIPAGRAITGRTVALGKPVSVPDMQAASDLLDSYLNEPGIDPRWASAMQWLKSEYNAMLSVPVRTRGEVYGALTLYYHQAQQFSDDVIGLAVAFADQAALVIENARLRDRVREAAVVEERNRLARDLHDAVTQTLFSASMIADTLPELWQIDQADARQQLNRLGQLTRGALAEMRSLLVELRPARLLETDMPTLLQQLVNAAQARSKAEITLNIQVSEPPPDDVKIALYRIAQEAFNNLIRHAAADHVFLSFRGDADQIRLQILDDGCGFDRDSIPPGHFGVQIMAERAAAIGASLDVDTRPGEGTAITVLWRCT